MKIIAYCPEVEDVSVEIGECEYDSEGIHLKRKVTYRISATKTDSKKWIFHFGDGSTESGEGTPPESIDHLYGNKPESPPKICLEGHAACEEICKEIDLSHFDNFKICPRCPEIKNISVIERM